MPLYNLRAAVEDIPDGEFDGSLTALRLRGLIERVARGGIFAYRLTAEGIRFTAGAVDAPNAHKRRRMPRGQLKRLTEKQQEAYTAYQRCKTYTATAKALDISRPAATKLVKAAMGKVATMTSGRSVPAHKLPTDRRGQVDIEG
ncbi:MAG: hypothetical protein V2A79_19575 [Planctomycetota bacterium]